DVFRIGRVRLPSLGFLAPMLLMWGVCVVILVWQRDLGTATLFFVIFMLMLYLASGQWIVLASAAILFIGAMVVAYETFAVVALRVNIWLDPFGGNAPDNESFQLVQSLIAVASGGVIGEGIGQGVPTFIPVVHSDLVFAALAEEWGLVGVVGLIIAILVIVLRGLRVAMKSQRRPFAAFLAAGLSIMIGTQSLLIIGGSLRLVPLTGVTLPFVSYGGSSLLTSFVAGGLLLILSEESET
ncbi:MAG: FtsW/RodA/SpoVE family cell cycle protein, partial [Anaerolineae bacterium]|nr:FtsW/RodA/SpoVE family cell cycle protein [Anaerolineae bacterium]